MNKVIAQCICMILITISGLNASAREPDALKSELLQRTEATKLQISKLESEIAEQHKTLQNELASHQDKLKSLRKHAHNLKRVEDEAIISIESIENRIEQWSTQSTYQKHLLRNYRELIGDSEPSQTKAELQDNTLLNLAHTRIGSAISPTWQVDEVIYTDGLIQQMSILRLGPITIGYDKEQNIAGPLNRDTSGQLHLEEQFDETVRQQIDAVKSDKFGYLTFDPSLGNAKRIKNQNAGAVELIKAGGLWAIPILFFGLLAALIALFKAQQLFRLPSVDVSIADQLHKTVGTNQEEFKTFTLRLGQAQKKLINIAVNTPVSQHRDDLLVAQLKENKYELDRFMGVIATVAAVAPLLGLLGTVSGMINTFKMMTIFGSGDPSTVSGGISEALVTTELGLIVAIPSLLISALLTRKTRSYAHKLETFAIKLSTLEFKADRQ